VCNELLDQAHHDRVRVLLIRRHGRSQPEGIRVFAAYTHPTRPWLESTTLSSPEELLRLDLARLGTGVRLGLTRHDDPLFCVCTHGRHDACCAERGRPVAATLAASHPEQTWEVSHIGGDRFAGNVLVLPDGLYYGRVTPESAPGLATGHLTGLLDLDRLRGRSCYPFTVQAAETMLRRRLGVTEVYGVRLDGHRRVWPAPDPSADEAVEPTRSTDRFHEIDFAVAEADGDRRAGVVPSTRWRVRLRTHPAQPTALTCRALRETAAPTYTLIDIHQIDT
jgi:hypothetical protein